MSFIMECVLSSATEILPTDAVYLQVKMVYVASLNDQVCIPSSLLEPF
jgi:hypothetical protein